jgi:hypothetical protein
MGAAGGDGRRFVDQRMAIDNLDDLVMNRSHLQLDVQYHVVTDIQHHVGDFCRGEPLPLDQGRVGGWRQQRYGEGSIAVRRRSTSQPRGRIGHRDLRAGYQCAILVLNRAAQDGSRGLCPDDDQGETAKDDRQPKVE